MKELLKEQRRLFAKQEELWEGLRDCLAQERNLIRESADLDSLLATCACPLHLGGCNVDQTAIQNRLTALRAMRDRLSSAIVEYRRLLDEADAESGKIFEALEEAKGNEE